MVCENCLSANSIVRTLEAKIRTLELNRAPDAIDELHAFELLQKEGSLDLRSMSLILQDYQRTGNLGKAIENEHLRIHEIRYGKKDYGD